MKITMPCTLAILIMLHIRPSRSDSDVVAQNRSVYIPATVCPCELKFYPVCGSDGVTYYNDCLFKCANDDNNAGVAPVVAVDDSKCSGCACQKVDFPVCAANGITYPNECELNCETIKRIRQKQPIIYLDYRRTCLGSPCNCTTIAAPVCGTDNVLYRNRCVLDCASINAELSGYPISISLKNVGACLDGCLCPAMKEPVCGTDGNVYDNLCFMACQNRMNSFSKYPQVDVANMSFCDSCDCGSVATDPVCGSDGFIEPRTFRNICELKCMAVRSNNPNLKAIGAGQCSNCFCTGEDLPVCGTDLKTYANECELRCANYALPNGTTPISIFHYGRCPDASCDCNYCGNDYQPCCGSDGQTYWNDCWLTCSNNCRKRDGYYEVTVANQGSCQV